MSPRNRFGHTSSPCRQERGAECKTSSRSWRDGISHFLSDPPATHFSCFGSKSCISHIIPVAAPEEDFLSVIAKFLQWRTVCFVLYQNETKLHSAAFALTLFQQQFHLTQPLTVKNRWLIGTGSQSTSQACFPVMADSTVQSVGKVYDMRST